YLGVTNALAMLRLLSISDRAKDAEILALRHQVMVLERQLHGQKPRFTPLTGRSSRPAAPPPPRRATQDPTARAPRDRAALTPRPDRPAPRSHLPPEACRPPANSAVDPRAGAAPSAGQRRLGLPAHPPRTARPGHQGRPRPQVWEILRDAGIDPAPE